MSQVADYSIANASGATVRADLNNVLTAIASANSGTAEPANMYPFMIWVDTTNNIIKLRNGANDAWLTLPIAMNASNTAPSNLNVLGNLGVGSATTPAELIHGIASSGDANIRMEGTAVRFKKSGEDFIVYDGSNLKFETGGTEAARFDGNQRLGIGTASPSAPLEIAGETRIYPSSGTAVLRLGSGGAEKGKLSVDASSNMILETAGSEALRIDSSGRVGIGTDSPSQGKVDILDAGDYDAHTGHGLTINSNANNAYTSMYMGADDSVDSAYIQAAARNTSFTSKSLLLNPNGGDVGIGTDSPNTKLHVSSTGGTQLRITAANDNYAYLEFGDTDDEDIGRIQYSNIDNHMAFHTNAAERIRINSSGALLVGTTSTTIGTSNFGICLFADGRPKFSKNVSGASHVMNVYGNAGEFRVYGDGDVMNTNNSYAGISDQSVKENIVDATDKLEDLKQVQIRNYNLIDNDLKQIGVIAQEIEPIFPSLIKECNETGIKAVKYSVFVPILIKAIQELEARVAELEAA